MLLFASAWAAEVTLWHAWRGEERAALEAAAAQYSAAHPGTTVLPVFVPHEGLASKIDAAVPRGNGPDLFVFAHERVGDWAAGGVVLPVQAEAGLLPVALDALTVSDKLYGLPLAAKSVALFRNTTMVPEAPATTDALLRVAAGLTGDGRYGLAWETASAYQDAPWMHGFGGGVFAGDRVLLDRPENAAALAFVVEAARFGPADPTGALVTQLFNDGRAAMVVNGPWFLGELAEGLPYAVSPLPVVSATGRPAAPYVSVETLFLAREGAEAREFAAWLAGPEGGRVRQDAGRQLVARTDLPRGDDPVAAAFAAQLEVGVPMPTHPDMAKTWEPLARALRRLVRGATSPEGAVAEAQTDFTIVTRPAPPPADPTPWLVGLGLVA